MELLNLSSGASHFTSPPEAAARTIKALEQNETVYRETEGLPVLREAISRRYSEDFQVEVPVSNILVTNGTKQALFNILFNLLQPGDEVILPQPGWFAFPEMFELLQVKPVYLETYSEDQYAIRPENLEALITEKTRLLIYSNPNNPTGRVYSREEIAGWLKVLENYPQVKILSDEIYDLVLFDGVKLPTLLQLPEMQEKALVVNGFSKNFAMSGWRVGYLIAPSKILENCAHFQHTTISGVNPFVQEGCVAALENRRDFMQKSMAELTRNRQLLLDWLQQQTLVSGFVPEGTYYVFADFRKLLQTEFAKEKNIRSSADLFRYLKVNLGIELQPGDKFGRPGFARITFAVPEEILQEAIKRLDVFLAEFIRLRVEN